GGVPSQQRVTMVAYYVGQGRASLGAESHHVAGIKVLAQSDWRVRPYVMVVAGDTRNMAHGRPGPAAIEGPIGVRARPTVPTFGTLERRPSLPGPPRVCYWHRGHGRSRPTN